MGLNTMSGREKQDKKVDNKKSSSFAVDKVVDSTKNKVRDIHKK